MTKTPEELRAQVVETRDRLGDTVEELMARADVKGRAQHKAAEVKEQIQQTAAHAAETGRRNAVRLAVASGTVLATTAVVRLYLRHPGSPASPVLGAGRGRRVLHRAVPGRRGGGSAWPRGRRAGGMRAPFFGGMPLSSAARRRRRRHPAPRLAAHVQPRGAR